MITGVYIAAAAVCVFVIAAVVIGREARRLDAVAPRAVYDPDQAVEFVADMLPDVTQARLTLDELGAMLRLHMRWLHAKGLQPDRAVDKRQDIDDLLLISEDQLSAFLLSEAEKSGVELLDDVDVVHVVRAHLAYFDAIGAVGPTASSTDL
ncbi:MAG: hypothetical protein EBU67_04275 [Actinobacteria bacterium]|nr:hypothetical protein [Actinomycetota bacterium]NBP53503.1 hypothetical protein [Actinomycetota bacterium]